ncbi:MAG: FtsH protease activity modulator HflK [Bdellovibrionaceae bacterium]|nr:FtsH protease activity modulator HflK [Pseudobdellovibrionaceae bacterium]
MKKLDQFGKKIGQSPNVLGYILLTIFTVAALLTSFYTVEPDEEAVIIRLGKYQGTYPPGLHFKLPFGIDRLEKLKTKLVHQAEFGFRTQNSQMMDRTQYSGRNLESESSMLTGDLNVADVEWVVHYQIADPFKYLFQASDPVRNLRDVSESILRRVVGDRVVTEVLTTGRLEMAADAKVLTQEILDKYDIGIRVVAVKLQDINPPEIVKPSFNEVVSAKQEQEKLINEAEEAYNKVIPEARGKAEKVVSEAQGYEEAIVNMASGDAQKFAMVLKEYERAPAITRKRIYIETMEGIYSKFDGLTIVDPSVKGLLPVFSDKDLAKGLSSGGAK